MYIREGGTRCTSGRGVPDVHQGGVYPMYNREGGGVLQEVIQPPPLKTRFCRGFGHLNHAIGEFRKKNAEIPPEGWSSGGGGFPHFFSKIGDNMVWGGKTFLKNWSKTGVPLFWALFGNFGASGENNVPDWSPRGCKPAKKTVHHPSWVISEALPRVYFALPPTPDRPHPGTGNI